MDDPTNFGRRERLSNVYIKPDYFGFGRMLSDRLSFVLGFFKSLPGKSTLLLGGKITNAKLMFLQACGHLFQNVVLVGEVGFAISSWATVFQPSLESTSNHKDRFYREFISSLQEKTNVILPRDANTLAPSTKDEQAPAAVADPKKKPADAKDPKAPKEEVSQIDEVGSLRAALGRSILQPHETELLAKHQKLVSFSGFDLAHVEEYEALLLEEAEQKKREEAARAEQERIRREEEAAKDPKKKGAAVPEKPKEATGKKPDTKPGADGPKTSTALEGSHVSREVPPFRAADSKIYFTAGMTGVSWGNETKQEVMKIVSHSNNLLWLGRLECSQALPLLDKDVAKALKNMRTAADAEEATLNADARERYVPLKIGIVGENLIGLVNSLDLKDPPPPKEAKRRRTDDEDGEGEEEQEEEPEEDSEEEEDFDDDMSSGQIRRLRKKDNVDQITGLYQPDERAVLQLLSGELLEELDRVDQAPKVVIDPDDIPFPHLVDI